jgi:hypothetical protein
MRQCTYADRRPPEHGRLPRRARRAGGDQDHHATVRTRERVLRCRPRWLLDRRRRSAVNWSPSVLRKGCDLDVVEEQVYYTNMVDGLIFKPVC